MELSNEEKRVRVQFVTKFDEYRVTDTSIAVPAKLGRYGLSEVINHLLDLADQPIPFDFIHVDKNKLIRTTLTKYMEEELLSEENVLKLEYLPAVKEPEQGNEVPHEDWIASVDAKGSLVVDGTQCNVGVTGSYDGSIKVMKMDGKGETVAEMEGAHDSAIKAVATVYRETGDGKTEMIVSAAKDGQLSVWEIHGGSSKLTLVGKCIGHGDSVESVDVVATGGKYLACSGSWDKNICVWDLLDDESDDGMTQTNVKKSKTSSNGAGESAVVEHKPLGVFEGHSDKVSSTVWANAQTVYSGSWDHSIRAWDIEKQICTTVFNGNKVVSDLAFNGKTEMIASAHPDHVVRLWDGRAGGDSVVKMKLDSHKGWVTGVSWHPHNENVLASCSVDKTVKLWDIRSNIPLHTLSCHTHKVFALDWSTTDDYLVSGGADSKIVFNQLKI